MPEPHPQAPAAAGSESDPAESDFGRLPGAAVVTGGTGGIGRAITRMLAGRGCRVAFTYRSDAAGAQALISALPRDSPEVKGWRVDLSDADAAAAFTATAAQHFGAVHTLVYASGPHVPMVYLSRVTPEQFRRQLDQDAVAFFNVLHPSLPYLRAASGSLVAVTTAATRRYPVRDGLSAAPKGAVEALVRGIAAEEGRFGVRANCVGPGMLTDGMAARLIGSGELGADALEVARQNTALRRFGTAGEVAELVCFLASSRASFISGQLIDVDGGYGV